MQSKLRAETFLALSSLSFKNGGSPHKSEYACPTCSSFNYSLCHHRTCLGARTLIFWAALSCTSEEIHQKPKLMHAWLEKMHAPTLQHPLLGNTFVFPPFPSYLAKCTLGTFLLSMIDSPHEWPYPYKRPPFFKNTFFVFPTLRFWQTWTKAPNSMGFFEGPTPPTLSI